MARKTLCSQSTIIRSLLGVSLSDSTLNEIRVTLSTTCMKQEYATIMLMLFSVVKMKEELEKWKQTQFTEVNVFELSPSDKRTGAGTSGYPPKYTIPATVTPKKRASTTPGGTQKECDNFGLLPHIKSFLIARVIPGDESTYLPFMKAMLKDQLRIPWNELKLDLQKFFMGTGQEAQLDAFFERKKHHSNRDLCKLLTFVTLPQHPYFDPRIIRGIHFDITCGYGDHQSAWSPMLHLELVPLAELYVKKLEEVQNAERLAIREYWTLRWTAFAEAGRAKHYYTAGPDTWGVYHTKCYDYVVPDAPLQIARDYLDVTQYVLRKQGNLLKAPAPLNTMKLEPIAGLEEPHTGFDVD